MANPLDTISERAIEIVTNNPDVPQKDALTAVLHNLQEQSYYIEEGGPDLRTKFVGVQGIIEHVLAQLQNEGTITQVKGVIHVPTPATPLCTLPESDPKEVMDIDLASDPDKRWTVHSRAILLRQYLLLSSELYSVYPEEGMSKRPFEQQVIYHRALVEFPDNLHDCPVNTPDLSGDLIGATYLFADDEGNRYCFAIRASQVNVPGGEEEWGLWLGNVTHEAVATRVNRVFDYLQSVKGPDLR